MPKLPARPPVVKRTPKSRRPPSTRTTPDAIRAKVDDPDVQAFVQGAVAAAREDERQQLDERLDEIENTIGDACALAAASATIAASTGRTNIATLRHLGLLLVEAVDGVADLVDGARKAVRS